MIDILNKFNSLIISLAALLTFSYSSSYAETVYKFGVVPQFEARRLHQTWQPLLNYLEKETGYRFEMRGSPTIPAFETEFLVGEFDFAYMNPYHLMLAHEQEGYHPLVKDVNRKLFGVLVAHTSGNVDRVEDLQGKVIAFPAPNALGASLQMRQELVDHFSLNFTPRYVKTHDSVYLNVLLGEAAAGGGVQKTLSRQKPIIQEHLKIIHKTAPVSPHPIAAHPRVPSHVTQAVEQALLKLDTTAEGKKLLAPIPIEQIGKASIKDYLALKQLKLERFYINHSQ